MHFGMLGPLEIVEGDRSIPLGRGRERAVLALLLLHANEVVPRERLIEELWGEEPPVTVAKNVQTYVWRLRRALRDGGDGPLVTRAGGYMLRLGPEQYDVERFERLLEAGRQALEAREAHRAADLLQDALALWRGPPLVDFGYESFAQAEIARLEELRLVAQEERIAAELALGRHAGLVAELETLVAAQPLRERLRGQLMLALYRFALDAGGSDAVAEICGHVDRLPLGIELAAARCGLLSPGEIAERLPTALATPAAGSRDRPARQLTLMR